MLHEFEDYREASSKIHYWDPENGCDPYYSPNVQRFDVLPAELEHAYRDLHDENLEDDYSSCDFRLAEFEGKFGIAIGFKYDPGFAYDLGFTDKEVLNAVPYHASTISKAFPQYDVFLKKQIPERPIGEYSEEIELMVPWNIDEASFKCAVDKFNSMCREIPVSRHIGSIVFKPYEKPFTVSVDRSLDGEITVGPFDVDEGTDPIEYSMAIGWRAAETGNGHRHHLDKTDIKNYVEEYNLASYASYALEKFNIGVTDALIDAIRERNGNWDYKGWLDSNSYILPDGFEYGKPIDAFTDSCKAAQAAAGVTAVTASGDTGKTVKL